MSITELPHEDYSRKIKTLQQIYPDESLRDIEKRIMRAEVEKDMLLQIQNTQREMGWKEDQSLFERSYDDYADIELNHTTGEFISYRNKEYISLYTITYEKELEGMYCEDTTFLYMNSILNHEYVSCHDIIWVCNRCDICLKRRRLKIMRDIEARFNDRPEVNTSRLYTLEINKYTEIGLSPTKISNRIKYLIKSLELNVDILLHTENNITDSITYLLEGALSTKLLGYDDVDLKETDIDKSIQMVGLNNKYRFMGKFYKKVPEFKIAGMTQEELDELENQEHYKSDKCNCGVEWNEHVAKKVSGYEMANLVVAEDHYKVGHEKFVELHLNNLIRQQKLTV